MEPRESHDAVLDGGRHGRDAEDILAPDLDAEGAGEIDRGAVDEVVECAAHGGGDGESLQAA